MSQILFLKKRNNRTTTTFQRLWGVSHWKLKCINVHRNLVSKQKQDTDDSTIFHEGLFVKNLMCNLLGLMDSCSIFLDFNLQLLLFDSTFDEELWCNWLEVVRILWPVDVNEGQTVPHILLHLSALVLLSRVRLAQSDRLTVFSLPCDGWP